MMEPFYIRETAEPMTPEWQRAWFERCAAEATSEGAKLCRFTVHPTDPMRLLVEGWAASSRDVGDQGNPRFSDTNAGGRETA